MKRLVKLSLLSLIPLLMACGISSENEGTSQREIRDRDNLKKLYFPLTGEYRGVVEPTDRSTPQYPVQINMILAEESAGTDEYGREKYRPALRAYFKRLDVQDIGIADYFMKVGLIAETGEIYMTSVSGTVLPGNPYGFLTVTAQVVGNGIIGTVGNNSASIGKISVEKVK